MKTVTITLKYRVTDEFYDNEMKDSLVADILSGKFQREQKDDISKRGLKWIRANVKTES